MYLKIEEGARQTATANSVSLPSIVVFGDQILTMTSSLALLQSFGWYSFLKMKEFHCAVTDWANTIQHCDVLPHTTTAMTRTAWIHIHTNNRNIYWSRYIVKEVESDAGTSSLTSAQTWQTSMSCAEEEYHYITMATGSHNQQTVRITYTTSESW